MTFIPITWLLHENHHSIGPERHQRCSATHSQRFQLRLDRLCHSKGGSPTIGVPVPPKPEGTPMEGKGSVIQGFNVCDSNGLLARLYIRREIDNLWRTRAVVSRLLNGRHTSVATSCDKPARLLGSIASDRQTQSSQLSRSITSCMCSRSGQSAAPSRSKSNRPLSPAR